LRVQVQLVVRMSRVLSSGWAGRGLRVQVQLVVRMSRVLSSGWAGRGLRVQVQLVVRMSLSSARWLRFAEAPVRHGEFSLLLYKRG
jgi:hypothetical protein